MVVTISDTFGTTELSRLSYYNIPAADEKIRTIYDLAINGDDSVVCYGPNRVRNYEKFPKIIFPDQNVLDVGCGNGPGLYRLSGTVGKNGKVIGTDINENYLSDSRALVKKYQLPNVEVRFSDARKPISGKGIEKMDVVFLINVLFYLPEREASLVLDNCSSVCNSNKGKFVLFLKALEPYAMIAEGLCEDPDKSRKCRIDDFFYKRNGESYVVGSSWYRKEENSSWIGTLYTKQEISEELSKRGFSSKIFPICQEKPNLATFLNLGNPLWEALEQPTHHIVLAEKN